MYQRIVKILSKFISPNKIFKYGFNWSPMYRRSTGKRKEVSKDLYKIRVEIPISYKNKNYVGAIFGGSLFASTDPIYMIQLMQILGDDYVVWDKAATIKYKRPARQKAVAMFRFSEEEIQDIKAQVSEKNEIDIIKNLSITSESGEVFSTLEKTIYIANKAYYKEKLRLLKRSG